MVGGLKQSENKVTKQFLKMNESMKKVTQLPDLLEPRFAHAAIQIKNAIYVTGGISKMDHPLGLRLVPMGERDCFKYDLSEGKWEKLSELPIGKLYSTLVAV